MRFDKRCQLERLVSEGSSRYPALRFVHATKGYLEACNELALAVVPVTLEDGEKVHEVLLNPRVVEICRKVPGTIEASLTILANGKIKNSIGYTMPGEPQENLKYPDLDAVTPDPGNRPPDLVIDPYLLLRLAEALGASIQDPSVAVWLPERTKYGAIEGAIYVRPLVDTGAYGVIMPKLVRSTVERLRPILRKKQTTWRRRRSREVC